MKKNLIYLFPASVVIASVLAIASPVSAAAAPAEPQIMIASRASTTPTNIYQSPDVKSCFDYYRFGSVPVVISGDLTQVAQSSTLGIHGTITNENAYPIIGATVYAKVFHKRGNGEKDSFGPDVVDWFPVAEDITLTAGEKMPLNFVWKVPRDLEPGDYEIATFVAQDSRFNLLGLTFTNDIVGGIYNFSVSGDSIGATRFDLKGIVVGDQVVHSASFAPSIQFSGSDVSVTAHVANSSAAGYHGTVDWKLYWWDSLQASHLIDETKQEVKVQPHSDTILSYTVKDRVHSVYYLVGTLTPSDTKLAKSVIGVRFVQYDVDEPRLNFLGVTEYPAKAGTTLFACLHSSGRGPADNVRLEVTAHTLSDPLSSLIFGEKTLATKTYSGEAPGMITAITAPFDAPASSFELEARLYQDDMLVDEVEIPYRCSALKASCGTAGYIVAGAVSGIILLIAAAWWAVRSGRLRRPRGSKKT